MLCDCVTRGCSDTPPSRRPRSWDGEGEVLGVVPLLRAEGGEESQVRPGFLRRQDRDVYYLSWAKAGKEREEWCLLFVSIRQGLRGGSGWAVIRCLNSVAGFAEPARRPPCVFSMEQSREPPRVPNYA